MEGFIGLWTVVVVVMRTRIASPEELIRSASGGYLRIRKTAIVHQFQCDATARNLRTTHLKGIVGIAKLTPRQIAGSDVVRCDAGAAGIALKAQEALFVVADLQEGRAIDNDQRTCTRWNIYVVACSTRIQEHGAGARAVADGERLERGSSLDAFSTGEQGLE